MRSVLEVGCSLGYNLRYMETELFPSATVLDGVDLDCYAIQSGQEYLRAVKSHISLHCGDMQQLEDLLGDRCYDVIICCGVLMYIREVEAAAVVRTMLAHSRILVALTGLAHPSVDNERLDHSEVRHCTRRLYTTSIAWWRPLGEWSWRDAGKGYGRWTGRRSISRLRPPPF